MVFQVVIYGCESWIVKKVEHQRIDTFELWCWRKTLESPLDCKKIQPIHPKGNQSWVFIGRTDAEAETPILWPPHAKSWLVGKDFAAGRDWGQKEKGTTEDEMVGRYHCHKGHEFEQAPGAGEGQGSLACCSPWGCKELDTTEGLNWTDTSIKLKKRASQVAVVVKNLTANAGDIRDVGLIPGSGWSPGGGDGNPLQCSCLKNPMDRGDWPLPSIGL